MSALDYMKWQTDYKAPKCPGLNAQQLQPSICPDHWRTSAGEKVRRNAQYRKPRTLHGRATTELMPGNARMPKNQRTIARIDPVGTCDRTQPTAAQLLAELA
jgi:hypothetical protein